MSPYVLILDADYRFTVYHYMISDVLRLEHAFESNYVVPTHTNRILGQTFVSYFRNVVHYVTREVSVEIIFLFSLQGGSVNTYQHVNRQVFNVKCFLL